MANSGQSGRYTLLGGPGPGSSRGRGLTDMGTTGWSSEDTEEQDDTRHQTVPQLRDQQYSMLEGMYYLESRCRMQTSLVNYFFDLKSCINSKFVPTFSYFCCIQYLYRTGSRPGSPVRSNFTPKTNSNCYWRRSRLSKR